MDKVSPVQAAAAAQAPLFAGKRVLYISSIDISIGNGPGVNEREFVGVLADTLGERAHFLIPKPRTPVVSGAQYTFSAPFNASRPWTYAQHLLSQWQQVNSLLRAQKFDLLIFRVNAFPLVQYGLARRYPRGYVIKTLGIGIALNAMRYHGFIGRLVYPFHSLMIKTIIKNALAIDTVGERNVEFLTRNLNVEPERIISVENGVNTSRFFPVPQAQARQKLGLERFDRIIGFVGGHPSERGGRQLVGIAARLREKFPKVGVVVVGTDKHLDELRQMAQDAGVADVCVFPGYVPFESIPDYVNAFDVGISLNVVKDREHFDLSFPSPQKIHQYIACGKPVICGTGDPDFIPQDNLGTMVQDTSDLDAITAAAVQWLGMSDAERQAFTGRAVAYAEDNLSVNLRLRQRLAFWGSWLARGRGA